MVAFKHVIAVGVPDAAATATVAGATATATVVTAVVGKIMFTHKKIYVQMYSQYHKALHPHSITHNNKY